MNTFSECHGNFNKFKYPIYSFLNNKEELL